MLLKDSLNNNRLDIVKNTARVSKIANKVFELSKENYKNLLNQSSYKETIVKNLFSEIEKMSLSYCANLYVSSIVKSPFSPMRPHVVNTSIVLSICVCLSAVLGKNESIFSGVMGFPSLLLMRFNAIEL